MSGFFGDLSPAQAAALEEFRAAVDPLPNKPADDDYYYLRWLRARKFNVKKAVAMLQNHLEVRKKYGADTILQDWTPPEVLQKCFPGGFFGEDRDGHPVWYDSIGNLDFKGLHRSCQREDVLKLKIMHQEKGSQKLKEFSEKKGRHIETMTIVLDFGGLSLQKHYYWPGIDMVKEVLALGESGDPECLKTSLIIRAPSFFPMCYNVVKHVLDEKTREKIKVLGANWKEELQQYISPDQLPKAYGGTRCEPDELCTDHINPGRDVPPEYYLTNLTETGRKEMERVVVGRGSAHKVQVEVRETGSSLKWELVSSDYDIGFGITVKTEGKNKKIVKTEIVPSSRKDSHIIPEVGTHVCTTAGTYVLKFDNSYSWTRSKEIFYSIKLLSAGEGQRDSAPTRPRPLSSHASSGAGDDQFYDCDSATGPEVSTATGPEVSTATGTEVSTATGPEVSTATGPEVSTATGPVVSTATGSTSLEDSEEVKSKIQDSSPTATDNTI